MDQGIKQARARGANSRPVVRFRRGAVAIVCVLGCAFLLPGAAEARVGEAECLWRHLPAQVRQSVFVAYDRSGKAGLDDLPVDDAMVTSALHACGTNAVNEQDVPKIGASLVGAALEHAAARSLAAAGIPETRLSDAWKRTSPVDRKVIHDAVTLASPADAESSRRLFKAMAHAVARAGARVPSNWPKVKNRTFEAYLDYFQGRAQREEYERQY